MAAVARRAVRDGRSRWGLALSAKPVAAGLNPKWPDAMPDRAGVPRALNPTRGSPKTAAGQQIAILLLFYRSLD